MIDVGKAGEQLVVDDLVSNGWMIIDRNFHTRYGELDIVALKDGCLRFVEVKRRSSQFWLWDAVPASKVRRMVRSAEVFISASNIQHSELELSTAIVVCNEIEWINNCVDMEESWLYT